MKKIFLFIILAISLVIRVYKLDYYPYGLNADEAALGYNSYALLLTGKDEHGNSWPVNLESFGDFKPGGYAYILMPFIKIFGLSDFIVRLPSAIFGVIGVLGIYLLANKIFENKNIGLISALIASINPWLIHFSRGAWEVNVSTTLIIFGMYFSISWYKQNKLSNLIASVLFFVSSMYVYQSARILTPLIILGLLVVFRSQIIRRKKDIITSFIFGLALIVPLAFSLITSDAASRFSGVGFLSDEGPLNRVKELRGHYEEVNIFNRILHNRPVIYSIEFVQNYLDHFDLDFLFLNGDKIERSKIPETGQFHIVELGLLIVGLIFFSKNIKNKGHQLVLLWILVAPIPAALTFQTPHALRSHSMAIPYLLLIALGIYELSNYVSNKKIKVTVITVIVIAYIWAFARFVNQYIYQYPYIYPSAWQAGFKELVDLVVSKEKEYSRIIVTDRYDQPYILFLYYSKYDPRLFQFNHELTFRDKFNFSTVRNYSKFEFKNIDSKVINSSTDSLIIAHPDDVSGLSVNITDKITYSNGKPAFLVIEK